MCMPGVQRSEEGEEGMEGVRPSETRVTDMGTAMGVVRINLGSSGKIASALNC